MSVVLLQKIRDLLSSSFSKIDFLSVSKSGTDSSIISASSGKVIFIHHIFVNNHGSEFTKFSLRNGVGGDIIRDYGLAPNGGVVAENFKRPVEVESVYYDFESGSSPDISICIHYEEV